ncbi:penicillin acylase family protein [Antribacter sp. KLBMP9083]|uniref:Penicillin acylase family protein n=1 Tax=Antribacter soli TaxID=2910976 RepID=A0AA41QDM9_9MICO|nr:penicillin acylase family protein [Antribacter soli]MCF4120860.1 penicillin acylase family protein [Antribacter soli]
MSAPDFELFRDDLGVPHVRAADELALAYGQGYVTALDRGWQIEVDRWRAAGRLAARFGPGGLEWDRFAVRVRLADTARRVHAALGPAEREWLAAYTAGVNAGLAGPPGAGGGRDAPELAALEAGLPGAMPAHEPWPDWAPLGVFLVAHVLFSGFPNVLWRDHVARTLGPEHVGLFATDGGPSSGSNAWALHGSRTASGAPLLAGDPHRLMELPGVYQQVRLACDDHDVLGLAFPGVPGVGHFGHAGSVAWGITNALAHHVDVFEERLAEVGGELRAYGPDGWEPVVTGIEIVPVRGSEAVEVAWVETSRGPVVAGLHDDALARSGALGTPVFSVRTAARADADLGVASWRSLLRARTADDVAEAFAGWVDPVNRVLTADAGGTVLRLSAGRVPQRQQRERLLPVPAWTDAARPRPWAVLPAPEPVYGVAVDANERPARPGHDLGWAYCEHRADRIAGLLAAGPGLPAADQDLGCGTAPDTATSVLVGPGSPRPGWSAEGFEPVHGDTSHPGAAALLDYLRDADDVEGPATAASTDDVEGPATARLLDRLLAWADAGAHMDAASPEAALFARWRHALVRRLAAHPALAPLHAEPVAFAGVLAPWFAVTARVGDGLAQLLASGPVDARAEARAAWAEAAAEVVHPGEASDVGHEEPTWGDRHRLLPLHALAEAGLAADLQALPSLPLSGDTDTVRCTATVPGTTNLTWRGSVARWVWDLADRERSRWGVPFGASGDPRSPHFADQHETWARAGTVRVTTDRARLRPVRMDERAGVRMDERAGVRMDERAGVREGDWARARNDVVTRTETLV